MIGRLDDGMECYDGTLESSLKDRRLANHRGGPLFFFASADPEIPDLGTPERISGSKNIAAALQILRFRELE